MKIILSTLNRVIKKKANKIDLMDWIQKSRIEERGRIHADKEYFNNGCLGMRMKE